MKYLRKANWKEIIGWIWFGIMFFMFLTYIRHNISNVLDSDMASEMVLARQLSEEGKILSDQWYYSTELRILSTQLVFVPLFKILGTGYSWHRIRVLGTVICVIILMLSFYLLCRALKIKNFQYYAGLLLMPICYDYFFYVFCNLLYLPYIVITFLILALVITGAKRPLKDRRTWIELVVLFVLSVGAGTGGYREILVCFLPLFLAVCVLMWTRENNDKYKWFLWTGIALSGSGIGLLLNTKVLSKKYSFWDYSDITVARFSFSQLQEVINALLGNMGFQGACELMKPEILFKEFFFVCWFLLICCSVFSILKKKEIYSLEEQLVTVFTLCAIVLIAGLYTFTEMTLMNRYCSPVTVMLIPIVTIYLNKRKKNAGLYGILIGLAIGAIGISALYYKNNVNSWANPGRELGGIAQVIVDNGYENGYAGFWQANVLTELSDGKIEVWDYTVSSEGLQIKNMYQWLQQKSHIDQLPTGKVFVLLNSMQLENTKWRVEPDSSDILYQSDNYILYGFDSYEDVKGYLQ